MAMQLPPEVIAAIQRGEITLDDYLASVNTPPDVFSAREQFLYGMPEQAYQGGMEQFEQAGGYLAPEKYWANNARQYVNQYGDLINEQQEGLYDVQLARMQAEAEGKQAAQREAEFKMEYGDDDLMLDTIERAGVPIENLIGSYEAALAGDEEEQKNIAKYARLAGIFNIDDPTRGSSDDTLTDYWNDPAVRPQLGRLMRRADEVLVQRADEEARNIETSRRSGMSEADRARELWMNATMPGTKKVVNPGGEVFYGPAAERIAASKRKGLPTYKGPRKPLVGAGSQRDQASGGDRGRYGAGEPSAWASLKAGQGITHGGPGDVLDALANDVPRAAWDAGWKGTVGTGRTLRSGWNQLVRGFRPG